MLRGAAVAIVGTVVAVTGSLSASAIRGRLSAKPAPAEQKAPATAAVPDTTVPAPSSVVQAGSPTPTPEATAAVAVAAPIAEAVAPIKPVIAEGETTLSEGVIASRNDTLVTLSFDSPMIRTRMPDKFERFLRTTLAQVYGRAIDSTLAKVTDGAIVGQGNLLTELPERGIHLPVTDRWRLNVYPEIRAGKDGPLVVRYRVAVGRS